MIKYILCSIVVLTLVTLYLGYKKPGHYIFQKVVGLFLLAVLLNSGYIFMVELLMPGKNYFRFLPFALLYGPILYLAFKLSIGVRISTFKLLRHFIPFILASVIYIAHLIHPIQNLYLRSGHYALMALLISAYSIKILLYKHDSQNSLKNEHQLVNNMALLLLVVAAMILILAFAVFMKNDASNDFVPITLLYVTMFAAVFIAFKYTIHSFVALEYTETNLNMPRTTPNAEDTPRYQKSMLNNEMLDEYEQKLYALMIRQMVFLEPELSLQSLAREMRIPKHHLTQLLSVRIKENFYHYINRFRIDFACKLINQSLIDLTLEELAYKSGFNSKTSFNRHFKNQVGCTPSEYRSL